MTHRNTYTIKWLSDVHLNFYREREKRIELYKKINNGRFDSIIITGDLAECESLLDILYELKDKIKKPIYYVLGNHDFYEGSKTEAITIAEEFSLFEDYNIVYLPDHGHIKLNRDLGLCLVGVNGWADGRNGSGQESYITLDDRLYISDLREAQMQGGRPGLFAKMQEFADEDAHMLTEQLMSLPIWCTQVIVATHIPPFTETSFYRGQPSSPAFLPFYSSKALGDVIKAFAEKYPQIQVLSISGHTHGGGEAQILPNLIAKTHNSGYYNLKAKLLRFNTK